MLLNFKSQENDAWCYFAEEHWRKRVPTTIYRVWLDYLAGRAKKRAETRKPSVQYEGKEGVSLWRADLRLKAKHTQRSQARPVTITWKRPSEEGPWTEAPHRGTRTRAYLYTIDWAVELERNSRSPGFSPGSTHTHISTPTVQYTCTMRCGTLKTLHLNLLFWYCFQADMPKT